MQIALIVLLSVIIILLLYIILLIKMGYNRIMTRVVMLDSKYLEWEERQMNLMKVAEVIFNKQKTFWGALGVDQDINELLK